MTTTEQTKLFRITETDRQALRSLNPWFESNMSMLVNEFYSHLGQFPEAIKIINQSGSSVERLKETNPRYFMELVKGEFGADYFKSREIVGQIHARIGLEPYWFFGAMTTYIDAILPRIIRENRLRSGAAAKTLQALMKAFCFDQSLIMSAYISGYTKALHDSNDHVMKVADQLSQNSAQLRQSSVQCGQSTQEVASATRELAAGTNAQTQSAENISHSMDLIFSNTRGVATGISAQADRIDEAQSAAEGVGACVTKIASLSEIWESLKEQARNVEELRQSAQLSAESVHGMHEAATHIEQIVTTIENVAAQTNLLALNAAIEAARAGEHGRGFAVVADQVRKLAEESSSSSQKIADLIRSIQDQSGRTSRAMDETVVHVAQVVTLASESATALEAIAASSHEASRFNKKMAESMTRVSEVAKSNASLIAEAELQVSSVRGAVQDVVAVITENSAATSELEASTDEVGNQIRELVSGVEMLDSLVVMLRSSHEETGEGRMRGAA